MDSEKQVRMIQQRRTLEERIACRRGAIAEDRALLRHVRRRIARDKAKQFADRARVRLLDLALALGSPTMNDYFAALA